MLTLKRIIAVLIAICLIASTVACNGSEENSTDPIKTPVEQPDHEGTDNDVQDENQWNSNDDESDYHGVSEIETEYVTEDVTENNPDSEHGTTDTETTSDTPDTEEDSKDDTIDEVVREKDGRFTFELNSDRKSYALVGYNDREIEGVDDGGGANLVIPDTYKGKPVTRIVGGAFLYCYNLETVVIPDTVTAFEIFQSAYKTPWFNDSSKLKSIVLGNGITEIPDKAFYGLYSLQSVTMGDNVTSIGEKAFACGITEIKLPKSLTAIGNQAFYCSALRTVVIPDSVVSIGDNAFVGCSELLHVTLGKGVETIGKEAFADCERLIEICNRSSLRLTAGAEENGYIAKYAEHIYSSEEGESRILITDNYALFNNGSRMYLVRCYGGDEDLVLPETINGESYDIYRIAFRYPGFDLKSITIPEGVTEIQENAFESCRDLALIKFPMSLVKICVGAFRQCNALISIDIPSSVKEIEDAAFYDCESLAEVNIAEGVTTIGDSAFDDCVSLKSITIPDSVTTLDYYKGFTRSALWFFGCSSLETVVIGSGIKEIPAKAFYECESIKNIIIRDGATKIGAAAFFGCKNLETVVIPDSVTVFETSKEILGTSQSEWFSGCFELRSVSLGKGITVIPEYAFFGVESLLSFTIQSTVTSIENFAFGGCYRLVEIYNLSDLDIVLDENVGFMGNYSHGSIAEFAKKIYTSENENSNLIYEGDFIFYNDEGEYYLISYIGDSDTIIFPEDINGNSYGIYGFVFRFREDIKSIKMSDGITSVGENAFIGCTGLTELTIGKNVTGVGPGAFSGCVGVETLTLHNRIVYSNTTFGFGFAGFMGLKVLNFTGTEEEIYMMDFFDDLFCDERLSFDVVYNYVP